MTVTGRKKNKKHKPALKVHEYNKQVNYIRTGIIFLYKNTGFVESLVSGFNNFIGSLA